MLVGHVGRIEAGLVAGWAADTEAPDVVVDVVIYIDGKRVARVACDVLRPDLRDLGTLGAGRHGFHLRFPTPLSPEVLDRVSVRFARSGAIVPDGEKVTHRSGGLQPILVTAPGRSGTTLMMSLLSNSSRVCLAETPPFEVRLLSYWSTVVGILTAEADHDRSMHPDRLEGDGFKVGANPFSHSAFSAAFRTPQLQTEYFKVYGPGEIRDFARKMISEYYLRQRDDQGKEKAVYFAEKANNLERSMRSFTRALFAETREIILIRDPRDLLCSQLSYFKSQPDTTFHDITWATRELLRIKQDEAADVVFVKYEDLVLNRISVLTRLADALGIKGFLDSHSERERSVFQNHGTSESPERSIGRWTRELTTEQRAESKSKWGLFMSEFQYEP